MRGRKSVKFLHCFKMTQKCQCWRMYSRKARRNIKRKANCVLTFIQPHFSSILSFPRFSVHADIPSNSMINWFLFRRSKHFIIFAFVWYLTTFPVRRAVNSYQSKLQLFAVTNGISRLFRFIRSWHEKSRKQFPTRDNESRTRNCTSFRRKVTYLYIRLRLLRGRWRWRKRTTGYRGILLRGRAWWLWKRHNLVYKIRQIASRKSSLWYFTWSFARRKIMLISLFCKLISVRITEEVTIKGT